MTASIRVLLVALLAALAAPAFAAGQMYRWVDAEGRVHYSDKPQPGAEELAIPEAQTFESSAAKVTLPAPRSTTPRPEPQTYTSIGIASPTSEEVLWNIEGELSVRASSQPALRPGHAYRWVFDGKPVDNVAQTNATVTIPEVWRGTHTLSVAIVDVDGNEVGRSPTVTFHVRQNSIAN